MSTNEFVVFGVTIQSIMDGMWATAITSIDEKRACMVYADTEEKSRTLANQIVGILSLIEKSKELDKEKT